MKIKKFLSVLLAVTVAVGMLAFSASASAVKDTNKDVTLTIYALETQDGSDVTVDTAVTGEQITISGKSPIQGAVFNLYRVAEGETSTDIPAGGTPVVTDATAADGSVTVTIPAAEQGRYLVVEANSPEGTSGSTVPFLVDLPMTDPSGTDFLYDVYVYPKQLVKQSDEPTPPEPVPPEYPEPKVSKLVSGDEGKTYGQEANIDALNGKKAYWKIISEIPENIADFEIYQVGDILDNRLVSPSASEVKASINGKELPSSSYKVTVSGQTVNVDFDVAVLSQYKNKNVDVIFPTAINVKAEKSVGVRIENIATLTYSKISGGNIDNSDTDITPNPSDTDSEPNPSDTDTDNVPRKTTTTIATNTVEVWTGSIEGFKHDKENKALSGAEFTLYSDKACKNVVGKSTSDKNGVFSFVGLKDGTYYLKETKVPDGYQANNTILEIKIDGKTEPVTAVDVLNIPKTSLPLTGGAGTVGISLIGIGIALAGVMIVAVTLKAYRKSRYAAA